MEKPLLTWPVVNGMRSIEFGNPGESRQQLNSLVLDGNKRATSGLLEWDYQAENEPLETVGECLALLDNDGHHIATLRVTRVEQLRFGDVGDDFALAEAEGDLTGDDYRAGHRAFWTAAGFEITDDTQVVNVYFDLVEDLRGSANPSFD